MLALGSNKISILEWESIHLATNEPPALPAYTKYINRKPKRKTKRLNDPFYIVQAALGGWIHPISSHANSPDDRAEVIETMWGYLRGEDCSRKLVVTVRVLVWVSRPVIDLQTTRGPVTITPVPTGPRRSKDGLDADQLHLHTHTWVRTQNAMTHMHQTVQNTFLPVWITCWTISHGH